MILGTDIDLSSIPTAFLEVCISVPCEYTMKADHENAFPVTFQICSGLSFGRPSRLILSQRL